MLLEKIFSEAIRDVDTLLTPVVASNLHLCKLRQYPPYPHTNSARLSRCVKERINRV